jgi:hypothetical protein
VEGREGDEKNRLGCWRMDTFCGEVPIGARKSLLPRSIM